jgi:hypothetical protein
MNAPRPAFFSRPYIANHDQDYGNASDNRVMKGELQDVS